MDADIDAIGDQALECNSPSYIACLCRLLREIDYRYEPPLPQDKEFDERFHQWITTVVKHVGGWDNKKLAALEDLASHFVRRLYLYASKELRMMMSKMMVITFAIDDAIADDAMYQEMERFSHRLYMREPQPAGTILELYEKCIQEMSAYYGKDPVLRGMVVSRWVEWIEAVSLEKRLVTVDEKMRASPFDEGYWQLSEYWRSKERGHLGSIKLDERAVSFPYFLRRKNSSGEAFAAAIFKAHRAQELPLTRYIQAIPDIAFVSEVMNDLLSFHKEHLEGETINLITLVTQTMRSEKSSSGGSECWTTDDTIDLLCNRVRDAFGRIDSLLRLDEYEKASAQNLGYDGDIDREMDMTIAKQWRGWRHGLISFHLESSRYKLDSLRSKVQESCTST